MITTNFKNNILKLMTAKTKQMTGTGFCYLGLSTTTPNADGSNFSEPTAASYARIRLNVNAAMQYTDMWGEVVNGVVTNNVEITSPECKESSGWGTATHFGIFDSETGGVPMAFDLLTDPDGTPDENGIYPAKSLTVTYKHVAVFRVGTLQLKLV